MMTAEVAANRRRRAIGNHGSGMDRVSPRAAGRRSRRSERALEIDRLSDEAARQLGRAVRAARARRRLTQAQLGAAVGLSQSEVSRLELGLGSGAPIRVWISMAAKLGLNPRFELGRDWREEPVDAGHLAIQELLLRHATATGCTGTFELPINASDPARSIDVFIRDDARRRLIVEEAWNSIGDLGAGARSFDRKMAGAADLAVALGGERPYAVHGVWVVRATARNRALVARYPEVFARRFPGSSRAWTQALVTGSPAPTEPGLVWCDVAASRLSEWRRPYSTTTPVRSSGGGG
jgi:transcriptional regulator with XRE-family HTH domain